MSCAVCMGHDTYSCPVCGPSPAMVTCPDCHGSGYTPYMAFDRISRKCIPVTELAWQLIPNDEDEAESMGMRFCKVEIEVCRTCRGEGEVLE